MLNAFFWGLVATSSLILGGIVGSWFNLSKRTIGVIMAFGAGVLISSVAYELVYEAVKSSRGSGAPAWGLFAGASTFFFSDMLIGKMGAAGRKGIGAAHQSSLVIPLVLGIILDGIPESTVLGLGILQTGTVSVAMLMAVFISNVPEAIAGSVGMRSGGWSRTKILLLYSIIALVCAFCTVAGYRFFASASPMLLSFVNTFAGGAILMMLANTMLPEAYENAGKLAGVFTVFGFAVAVLIVILEHS
jgi:ZIP family zinc transporter